MPIRITSKVSGFRQLGMEHPAFPVEYPDDRFTAEELAILNADPVLEVQVIVQKGRNVGPSGLLFRAAAESVEASGDPGAEVGHIDHAFLEGLKADELRKLAADMGLTPPDRATKKQLVEMLAAEPVTVPAVEATEDAE